MTDQPRKKKANTYSELGRRAIELNLSLYPLEGGGYAIRYGPQTIVPKATAAEVATFLKGVQFGMARKERS